MTDNVEDFPIFETEVSINSDVCDNEQSNEPIHDASQSIRVSTVESYNTDLGLSSGCSTTTFKIKLFLFETMNGMYDLFLNGKLTDVTLQTDGISIPCHRLVLASASPYFRAMFTTEMRESVQSNVHIRHVSSAALSKIVEFAYTGCISINEQNVCELLLVSSMLQMFHVVDACCTFLKQQLHPSNVIGILNFASNSSCESLAQDAQSFLDNNIGEVFKHEEFLSLHPAKLLSLLQRDELNVQSETEIYDGVIRWMNHDKTSRLSVLTKALSSVRCCTISPAFIRDQIKSCPLLAKVPSATSLLLTVLQNLLDHRCAPEQPRKGTSNKVHFFILYACV